MHANWHVSVILRRIMLLPYEHSLKPSPPLRTGYRCTDPTANKYDAVNQKFNGIGLAVIDIVTIEKVRVAACDWG